MIETKETPNEDNLYRNDEALVYKLHAAKKINEAPRNCLLL